MSTKHVINRSECSRAGRLTPPLSGNIFRPTRSITRDQVSALHNVRVRVVASHSGTGRQEPIGRTGLRCWSPSNRNPPDTRAVVATRSAAGRGCVGPLNSPSDFRTGSTLESVRDEHSKWCNEEPAFPSFLEPRSAGPIGARTGRSDPIDCGWKMRRTSRVGQPCRFRQSDPLQRDERAITLTAYLPGATAPGMMLGPPLPRVGRRHFEATERPVNKGHDVAGVRRPALSLDRNPGGAHERRRPARGRNLRARMSP